VVAFVQRALGQLAERSGSAQSPGTPLRSPRPPAPQQRAPRPRSPERGAPVPGPQRDRERRRPAPTGRRASSGPASAAAADSELVGTRFEYSPSIDGDPDPGEVVWTWVPYEDDPSQGKDRPVVLVGRRGAVLVGVALTSKRHDDEPQFDVGAGPWDRDGRPSYAKLERVLDVDPSQVRREGAILSKARFDDLIAALRTVHRIGR